MGSFKKVKFSARLIGEKEVEIISTYKGKKLVILSDNIGHYHLSDYVTEVCYPRLYKSTCKDIYNLIVEKYNNITNN